MRALFTSFCMILGILFHMNALMAQQDVSVTFNISNEFSGLNASRLNLEVYQDGALYLDIHDFNTSEALVLPAGHEYVFLPVMSEVFNKLACINFNDVLLIRDGILGLRSWEALSQLIAADVNNSGTVTASDIKGITEYIIEDQPLFINRAGRFLIEDKLIPWQYDGASSIPQELIFPDLNEDLQINFTYFIYGDIDGDCSLDLLNESWNDDDLLLEETPVKLIIENAFIPGSNQIVSVPLLIESNLSEKLRVIQVEFELSDENSGLKPTASEELLHELSETFLPEQKVFLYTLENNTDLENKTFELLIQSEDSFQLFDRLRLKTGNIYVVAYDHQNRKYPVQIEQASVSSVIDNRIIELTLTASPNPFRDITTLGFQIEQSGDYRLEVFNVQGKLQFHQDMSLTQGYQQIDLEGYRLGAAGVYMLRLSNSQYSGMLRLVRQ